MTKLSQYSLTVAVTPRSYTLVEIVQGCLWGHTHILMPQTLSLFPFPTFSPSPPSESGGPRERCKEFSVYFFIISSWSIIFLKMKIVWPPIRGGQPVSLASHKGDTHLGWAAGRVSTVFFRVWLRVLSSSRVPQHPSQFHRSETVRGRDSTSSPWTGGPLE